MKTVFDFIVIGAGSAGCALAARLSEDGRYSVLLVESGGAARNLWLHIPLGVGKLLTNEKYVWPFSSTDQANMAGQKIYSPRGKVLGGSSAVNGMAYIWGDPAAYDGWGVEGWCWKDVVPYFQKLEDNPYTTHPGRGHSGPVKITDLKKRNPDPISEAFIAACVEHGIPETDDYNAGSYEGVRYLEQTAENGIRCSAATAYLRDSKKRVNLKILTNAAMRTIQFDGTCATGVCVLYKGKERELTATREVLLAAGAIHSPQLLELSGLGDEQRIRGLGIPVVADLPQVGENLSDHLQLRRTYQTNIPNTINDLLSHPYHKIRFALTYLLKRKGHIAGTSSTAHAITRSRTNVELADIMVRMYQISGADRYSRSKAGGIDRYSGFTLGGFKLYPKSRGSVHAMSPDPNQLPKLEPNYLEEIEDQETALDILKLLAALANEPGLSKTIVAEKRPRLDVEDDAALIDYAKASGQTAWHTVGSCKMGSDGANSVVDKRLRVHGIQSLRVVDASILPTIPSSNTNAAAIMVGEKGADLVLYDHA